MDVLLSLSIRCGCCGGASVQAVTPAACGFDGGAGAAALDGIATDRGVRRGLQLCPSCGFAAPAIARAPRGARGVVAGTAYARALGRRAPSAGGRPERDDAARWLAYAEGFAQGLPPEEAGQAWAHAAAELEQPRLHRLGARGAEPAAEHGAAEAARRAAVARLMPLFEAEFGRGRMGGGPLAGLRRMVLRRRLGERARREAAWHACGHVVTDRRREGRFEMAALLVDLLRRVGEFVAAESVALRALRDGAVPGRLAPVLGFQVRLARAGDAGRHELGAVRGNVVALPVPAEAGMLALAA